VLARATGARVIIEENRFAARDLLVVSTVDIDVNSGARAEAVLFHGGANFYGSPNILGPENFDTKGIPPLRVGMTSNACPTAEWIQ